MSNESGNQKGLRAIRFDGTVTMGNVLTLVSMTGAVFALWRNMESRIIIAEERITTMDKSLNRVADNMEKLTIYTYQNRSYHQERKSE